MSLKRKVELAVAEVLSDAGFSADVFLGADSDEQTRPCVACVAEQGDESPPETGVYWFNVRAVVKSNADIQAAEDPAADHAALVTEADDALNVDDLAALLSVAGTDFHCLGVRNRRWETDPQGRSFTDSFLFEASCCNQDIS